MSPLEAFLVSRFMIFTLVLARTSGLVVTAPIFSSLGLPRQVRAYLAVALALLVTPLHLQTWLPPVDNLGAYGLLLANEAVAGLLLGLGINILFSGILVAGQVVSQMSGMSLADVFNPGFEESNSVFSQFFYFVTLAVFVAMGGHRIMAGALLDTFAWAPPGQALFGDSFVQVLVGMMSQSFALGIRTAAPLLIALLLSTLVLGLVSRTLPQINIIAVGFGLNSFLTLALATFTIGAVAWTFQDATIDAIHQLQEAIVSQPL